MTDPRTPSVFFILGRGRSGTSLLQTILNAHPSLVVPPEAQFITLLYRSYRHGPWPKDRLLHFSRDVFLEERLQNWGITEEGLAKRLLTLPESACFARVCRAVYEEYAAARGKQGTFLGDKNPQYCLYIKELLDVFPQARCIHVVRDPRDVTLSFQNVDFDLKDPAALAYRWVSYNKAVLTVSEQYPAQFTRIRFEDLLREPEKTLGQLCAFLNVPFDPAMMEFYKYAVWDAPWRDNLKKPLDAGKIEGWKKAMPTQDVSVTDAICAPVMKQLGYCPADSGRIAQYRPWTQSMDYAGATVYTWLERVLYKLPLWLSSRILSYYRLSVRGKA